MLFTIRLGILAIWGSSFSTISFSRRANENKIKMTWKNLTKEKEIHTIYSTHTHFTWFGSFGSTIGIPHVLKSRA